MLCRTIDNVFFFRVHHVDKSFTDYNLEHDNLPITIHPDAHASFYQVGDENWLRHSPGVLGLSLVDQESADVGGA